MILIEKYICDRRNISVKLPCVSVCFSFRDLFIFSERVSSLFFIFVLSVFRYFPFHMVFCFNQLSISDIKYFLLDNIHRLPSVNFLSWRSFIISRHIFDVSSELRELQQGAEMQMFLLKILMMKDIQDKKFKEWRLLILSNKYIMWMNQKLKFIFGMVTLLIKQNY